MTTLVWQVTFVGGRACKRLATTLLQIKLASKKVAPNNNNVFVFWKVEGFEPTTMIAEPTSNQLKGT